MLLPNTTLPGAASLEPRQVIRCCFAVPGTSAWRASTAISYFLTLACALGGVVLQLLALGKAERARGRQRAAAEAEARHVHEDETDYGNL